MNLRTPTATNALGGAGLAAIAALSWVFLIGPTVGGLSDTNEEHLAIQDLASSMSVQLDSLRAMAEDLPQMKTQADELATVFPPTADQPGFFRAITAAAEQAGLDASDLTGLSPGVPVIAEKKGATPAPGPAGAASDSAVAPNDIAEQVVGINLDGTYDQLRVFLGDLEMMDRALLVQSVALDEGDEEGKLSLTVTGTTFVAPPLADPPPASP